MTANASKARYLVKLGGKVLENFITSPQHFKNLNSYKAQLCFVHGGGALINSTAEKLGLDFEFVDGQRVTSPELMDVVEMLLRGRMNPELVRALEREGLKALGLGGSDSRILDCEIDDPQLGLVGRVKQVNGAVLEELFRQGFCPVVAPIGYYESSSRKTVNVNADMAAVALARELRVQKLFLLSDRDGILDSQQKTISHLNLQQLEEFRQQDSVYGGMLVKTRGIVEFLRAYPQAEVWVLNGLRSIDWSELIEFGVNNFGTRITA